MEACSLRFQTDPLPASAMDCRTARRLCRAFLATAILHLVLYQTLTGPGLVTPYLETPERILTPLVLTASFVWSGSRFAPSHQLESAVALLGVWLILFGGPVGFTVAGGSVGLGELYMKYGLLALFRALADPFFGAQLVRVGLASRKSSQS